MNRRTPMLLLATVVLACAEPTKIRLPNEAATLVTALSALDGQEQVFFDTANGTSRVIKTPYDFGKNAVRIRLATRKNLIALRDVLEVFEQTRAGYTRQVFGVDNLPVALFEKQPEEKRVKFNQLAATLLEPVTIDLELFTEEDVTTFAAAAVPGTVSVVLDTLVRKPDRHLTARLMPVTNAPVTTTLTTTPTR